MRFLITGVDANGRSCMVTTEQLDPDVDEQTADLIFATDKTPPPPRRDDAAGFLDLQVPVGAVEWRLVRWVPRASPTMHHTDTVDFCTVVQGEVTLELDDGDHELRPGDFVVVNGVDHTWRIGDSGAVTSHASLGIEPPS